MKYEDIEIAREQLYKSGLVMHHRATARKYEYDVRGTFITLDYHGRYGTGKKLVYLPGDSAKYLSVEYWIREE